MSPLRWETPPTSSRGRGRAPAIDAVVEELKANPGKWALVREDAASNARTPFVKRGCEVRNVTKADSHRVTLYARWPVQP